MKRRRFLKNILGAGTMGMFGVSTSSLMASAPAFSDYKALVCILLDGGNDAWNTFVPKGSSGNSGYDKYKDGRGDLTITILRLLCLSLSRTTVSRTAVVTHITRKGTTSKPIKKDIIL